MDEAQRLLDWFDAHRRDLPWRENQDPYRVWVSEIMLQQTQVATVIPYYQRFLATFPSVEALAAAEIDEVLALWSGLGYYRRARQLHAAACRIAELGAFPETVAGLRELPGIGAYTAAAVASIAFDVVEPVMDGNVERVLARKLALEGDPKKAAPRRALLAAAADLLDPQRPGDSNQALMELGAMVCTPVNPKCLLCSFRESCTARLEGRPEDYPPVRKRRATEKIRWGTVVFRRRDAVLLFRRSDDDGLLAGTWELPWFEIEGKAFAAPAAKRILQRRYGGEWRIGDRLGTVRHGITYRSLTVEVFEGALEGGVEVAESTVEAGWFDDSARRRLALSALVEKALRKAA
ncbi:MAG: A/G-specific adenine glycosylase [Acidobacteriota bacterium]